MAKTFREIQHAVSKAISDKDISTEDLKKIKGRVEEIIVSDSAYPQFTAIDGDTAAGLCLSNGDTSANISIGTRTEKLQFDPKIGMDQVDMPTVDTEHDKPLIAAMYCIDCFSMTGEKKYASMVGWGFSFCDEHAQNFIDNQKKIHHDSWMKANENRASFS